MQERRSNILNDLINAIGFVKSGELALKHGVTDRSIRYDIQALNNQLKDSGGYIQSDTHNGYRISSQNKVKIMDYLDRHFYELENYFPTMPVQRQAYIALVLLFSERPVSLEKIAQDLYVAKSTAKLDMDKALAILTDMHVAIEHNHKGTYVVIPEKRRRLLASFFLMYYINEPRMICVILAKFNQENLMDLYENLMQVVTQAMFKHHLKAKDVSISLFLITCLIARVRICHGQVLETSSSVDNEFVLEIIEKSAPEFTLPVSEWKELEAEFVNRTLESTNEADRLEAQSILSDFYGISSNEYALEFSENVKKLLLGETTKIVAKARKSIMERNSYTQQIIRTYPFAFEVALNLRGLIHSNNKYVPVDDIASIALIVANAQPSGDDLIKIAIISELGDIVMANIKREIENMVQYRSVELSLHSQYEVEYLMSHGRIDFDLVIATNEKLKSKVEAYGIDYVYITPFINSQDGINLSNYITKVVAQKNEANKNFNLARLAPHIHFDQLDTIDKCNILNMTPIRHAFCLKDDVLAVRLNLDEDYIGCVRLKNKFAYLSDNIKTVVIYSSKRNMHSNRNAIYVLIELIAKKIDSRKIATLKNKDEFIELILNTNFN